MKYGGVGLKRPGAAYLYQSIDGERNRGVSKHSLFNSIQLAQAPSYKDAVVLICNSVWA